MSMWKDLGFSKNLGHVLFRTFIFMHQGDWWARECWRTVIPDCCMQVKCCRSLLYAGCVWNNWHCLFICLHDLIIAHLCVCYSYCSLWVTQSPLCHALFWMDMVTDEPRKLHMTLCLCVAGSAGKVAEWDLTNC